MQARVNGMKYLSQARPSPSRSFAGPLSSVQQVFNAPVDPRQSLTLHFALCSHSQVLLVSSYAKLDDVLNNLLWGLTKCSDKWNDTVLWVCQSAKDCRWSFSIWYHWTFCLSSVAAEHPQPVLPSLAYLQIWHHVFECSLVRHFCQFITLRTMNFFNIRCCFTL